MTNIYVSLVLGFVGGYFLRDGWEYNNKFHVCLAVICGIALVLNIMK